jgi:hypothetical protein
MMSIWRRAFDGVEYTPNLFLHQVAQTLAVPGARTDRTDDAFGCGKTDVRGDEQFFERWCRRRSAGCAAPRYRPAERSLRNG